MCGEGVGVSCNFVCVYATMHVCLSVGCPCVSMHGYVCVVYTATERYLQKFAYKH